MSHTPETWYTSIRASIHEQAIVYDETTGRIIAITYSDADGKNANMISASRDMLDALERIVNDSPSPGEDAVLTAEGYNQACAAIAKARGE